MTKILSLLFVLLITAEIQAQVPKINGGSGPGDDQYEAIRAADRDLADAANKHFKECMGDQFGEKFFKSTSDLYYYLVIDRDLKSQWQRMFSAPTVDNCPFVPSEDSKLFHCQETMPFKGRLAKLLTNPQVDYVQYLMEDQAMQRWQAEDIQKYYLKVVKDFLPKKP